MPCDEPRAPKPQDVTPAKAGVQGNNQIGCPGFPVARE